MEAAKPTVFMGLATGLKGDSSREQKNLTRIRKYAIGLAVIMYTSAGDHN
jgi:hypothetical protein